MDKTYTPKPIDTSDVELSPEILELCEKLAENTHEVWASGRIAQGWKYGPVRDDAKKETPCLVPYAVLPESEKDYDRNTAMETLKLILKLGFEINNKGNAAEEKKRVFISYKSEEEDTAEALKQKLEEAGFICWKAPESIPGGSDYSNEIEGAIRECQYFIILLSNASIGSTYCGRELDRAIAHRKAVFPFDIERCALNDSFTFYLSTIQRIDDYIKDPGTAFDRLIELLKGAEQNPGRYHSEHEGKSVLKYNLDDFCSYNLRRQKIILKDQIGERRKYLNDIFEKLEAILGNEAAGREFAKGFELDDGQWEDFLRADDESFTGVLNALSSTASYRRLEEILSVLDNMPGDYEDLVDTWFDFPSSTDNIHMYNNRLKALKEVERDNKELFKACMNRLIALTDAYDYTDIEDFECMRRCLTVMYSLLFIRVCKSGAISAKTESPFELRNALSNSRRRSAYNSEGVIAFEKQGDELEPEDKWWYYTVMDMTFMSVNQIKNWNSSSHSASLKLILLD